MSNFTSQVAKINNELAKAYPAPARPLAKAIGTPAASESALMMSGEQFMMKALQAQAAGHISASQVSEAELHINAGKTPPAAITKAVVNGVAYSPWG